MRWPTLQWQISSADIRARVPDVNDGVLAVAGLAEGLSWIVQTRSLASIIFVASIAGALSVAGVQYAEQAAEREFQRGLIDKERELLALNPDEEIQELTEHFIAKGVSEETARRVALELNAADALTAQLETEYGISDLIGPTDPLKEAFWSGVCFLLGSLVPVLLAFIVPPVWVEEYILVGVAISLTVTAVVVSRLGQTRVLPTILRSLLIGAGTMSAAIVVGAVLSDM